MAVVINEFEVVAEPQAQTNGAGAAAEPPPAGPPPAQVIVQVLRVQRERALRVWAH